MRYLKVRYVIRICVPPCYLIIVSSKPILASSPASHLPSPHGSYPGRPLHRCLPAYLLRCGGCCSSFSFRIFVLAVICFRCLVWSGLFGCSGHVRDGQADGRPYPRARVRVAGQAPINLGHSRLNEKKQRTDQRTNQRTKPTSEPTVDQETKKPASKPASTAANLPDVLAGGVVDGERGGRERGGSDGSVLDWPEGRGRSLGD